MPSIWTPGTDVGLTHDELREEVQLHFARHLGECELAFMDADGWSGKSKEPGPPVDVLVVPPEGERRFAYVSSFGGALKQSGADVGDLFSRRVEFVLAVPQKGEEKSDRLLLNLAANTVRQFAKLAHLQSVRVSPGETVAFSADPEPMFEGSDQVAFAFLAPRLPAEGFESMMLAKGQKVRFVAPVPIYREELDVGHDRGPAFLVRALHQGGVTEMMDFARHSVVPMKRRRGWMARLRAFFAKRLKR